MKHYSDVIMSAMASQITGISIVYSTVCSGADQRKHQSSASLSNGIHRWPVNSPHKGPVTRQMFPSDDFIMITFFISFLCWSWDPWGLMTFILDLLIQSWYLFINHYLCAIHYDDVIMGTIASQITSLTSVYSTVYSGADQSKHQSSASLVFVWEFPAQMASYAENVSIWWRHHVLHAN